MEKHASQIAYTKVVIAAEKRHEERCAAASELSAPQRNATIEASRETLRCERDEAEGLLQPMDIYAVNPWRHLL